jgi:hypothetical protein
VYPLFNWHVAETPVAQPFPRISTLRRLLSSLILCADARGHVGVIDERAASDLTLRCQHFLKRDAVFFDALVYSGCSASRFPGARNDQAISLH